MSPSSSPAPWGGCWPRTARGGSPAPPTSSRPCNPSRSVLSWRSWPGSRRGRRLNEMLPTTYSVLHGCEFLRIRLRLWWSARADLPSKPSLVAILSAAARTQTETLRRHDMLPLGHQLLIGLDHEFAPFCVSHTHQAGDG